MGKLHPALQRQKTTERKPFLPFKIPHKMKFAPLFRRISQTHLSTQHRKNNREILFDPEEMSTDI